jgi:FkbM family methyltransferase
VENRNGLIVDAMAWEANGRAERDTALLMLEQVLGDHPVTVGGDKGFDTREFVSECRHMGVTPHVAQNHGRPGGSAIDQRTTRHAGYRISQRKRKRIEGVGDVEAEAIFTFLPKVTCGSGFYNQDDIRHRKDMVQALILSDPEKRKKFEDELGQELLEYYVDQALKGETILIPVQPISTIIRQCRLHNIDLLKIDVEGGDIKALHGIEENQWPVIKQFVLGVHDSRNNLPEVTAILEERGVNVIAVPENSGDISGVTMAYATRRG